MELKPLLWMSVECHILPIIHCLLREGWLTYQFALAVHTWCQNSKLKATTSHQATFWGHHMDHAQLGISSVRGCAHTDASSVSSSVWLSVEVMKVMMPCDFLGFYFDTLLWTIRNHMLRSCLGVKEYYRSHRYKEIGQIKDIAAHDQHKLNVKALKMLLIMTLPWLLHSSYSWSHS